MDDFERPETSKFDDKDVLQPDDVTPTEKVLSQLDAEMPMETPQSPAPEPLPSQKKLKKKVVLIILAAVLVLAMAGGVTWFVLSNSNSSAEIDQASGRNDEVVNITDRNGTVGNIEGNNGTSTKPDDDNIDTEVGNVNNAFRGRLYLLDSSNGVLHKQRYYLLVDDATYGVSEDFLKRKTYVMDLASVGSSDFIREVDLTAAMTPFVESYISEQRRGDCNTCSVKYFGFSDPMLIDFEREVVFEAYYSCTLYTGGEGSLGSRLYAFNVETNEIRDMGAVNY